MPPGTMRVTLLLSLALLLVMAASAAQPPRLISNVISPAHCPDPDVIFHEGSYYAARSRIEASNGTNLDPPGWNCWAAAQDQVVITKARRLEDIYLSPEATAVIIDRSNPMGGGSGGVSVGAFQISYNPGDPCPSAGFWAPALKNIDGHWFLFITGHRPDVSGEANFVMENVGGDPMDVGSWRYCGMLGHTLPGLDGEPIVLPTGDHHAATVTLRDNGKTITGQLYFVYSHNNPDAANSQQLNLVRLRRDTSTFSEYDADLGQMMNYSKAWTAVGEAPISVPMLDWEQQCCAGCNFNVNEGPTALYGPTSTFILYSASFCATKYYAVGMLEFTGVGAGFPFMWTKHPRPVFSGDIFRHAKLYGVQSNAFGIGHNSIATSPDLSEPWIIYHAKTTQTEGPADREARAQRFSWNPDGRPNFGSGPVGRGTLLPAPSAAEAYAVLCESPGFTGCFCVGVPPGRYSLEALARRGVVMKAVRSIRLVGGAAVRVFGDEGVTEPTWSADEDMREIESETVTAATAVEVVAPGVPQAQVATA